jgi:hypothetical protein
MVVVQHLPLHEVQHASDNTNRMETGIFYIICTLFNYAFSVTKNIAPNERVVNE